MKIRTNGFTLIEMLGVVALAGIGTATLMDMGKENLNAENKQFITDRIVEVMEGFDKRIAKDGYDAALWDTKSWTDNQQVLVDLFDNQLNLKINTIPLGLTISASLNSDNVNFVDEFELVLGYESANDFEANQKMFTALQYELSGKAINTVSGDVEYGYYHKTTNASLSRLECNKAKNDCLLKASWFGSRALPLKNMCSHRCVRPSMSLVSVMPPAFTARTIVTRGTLWFSIAMTSSPLSSSAVV